MMKKKVKLVLLVWTVGILGGTIFLVLQALKRIDIKGKIDKKCCEKKGLLIVSNHPSLCESALLPFLFFPLYLWGTKFVPISTPDRGNFYDKWWFSILRPVCIPVPRGDKRGEVQALQKMISLLQRGGILILFPEGGRTYRGRGDKFRELDGRKIREFQRGVGAIVFRAKPTIILLWTEGGENILPNQDCSQAKFMFPRIWRRMKIKIGEAMEAPDGLKGEKLITWLEDKLLSLAMSI